MERIASEIGKVGIKITGTLKKYDGDWTEEQILAGEADHACVETVTLEDGVIVDLRREG